jgi:hypothetical protein
VSSSTGRLGVRDDFAAVNVGTSGPVVTGGNWHTLQVHVNITTGQVEAWVDGSFTSALSGTSFNLGTDPVGIIQLGENSTGRTYDVRYDDAAVNTIPLP